MSQALIQQARTYLHEHGYAFWYDARKHAFMFKAMGTSMRPWMARSIEPPVVYHQILDIIGVPPEHRKPLTLNPNL